MILTCHRCGAEFKPSSGRKQKYCSYECRHVKNDALKNSPCWYCEYLYSCRKWVKQYDKLLPCQPASLLHDDWRANNSRYVTGGNMREDIELRMMEYVGQEVLG